VPAAHDGVEFIVWNSYHQVVPNDAAAHPAADGEREAAEHLALSDVPPVLSARRMRFASCSSYAMRILVAT
jgi:hypothetical protein